MTDEYQVVLDNFINEVIAKIDDIYKNIIKTKVSRQGYASIPIPTMLCTEKGKKNIIKSVCEKSQIIDRIDNVCYHDMIHPPFEPYLSILLKENPNAKETVEG